MKSAPGILIVDDERSVRLLLEMTLANAGYHVKSAASGDEALDAAAAEKFHLVITDINMPGRDGIETILMLRGRQPGLKIIAISGGGASGTGDYLPLASTLGAKRTLSKPIRGRDLLEAVSAEIGGPALPA